MWRYLHDDERFVSPLFASVSINAHDRGNTTNAIVTTVYLDTKSTLPFKIKAASLNLHVPVLNVNKNESQQH